MFKGLEVPGGSSMNLTNHQIQEWGLGECLEFEVLEEVLVRSGLMDQDLGLQVCFDQSLLVPEELEDRLDLGSLGLEVLEGLEEHQGRHLGLRL